MKVYFQDYFVYNYTILHHFNQKLSGEGPQTPYKQHILRCEKQSYQN